MPAPHICVNDLPASQSGNREGDRVAKSAGAFPGFCRDLKPQHRRLHEPGGTLDVDSLADLACGPCVLQSSTSALCSKPPLLTRSAANSASALPNSQMAPTPMQPFSRVALFEEVTPISKASIPARGDAIDRSRLMCPATLSS